MYVMIHFLDNLSPESFWLRCYVKEDDIDFVNKIMDIEPYENDFKSDVKLNSSNFLEFYTEEYDFAKKAYEGKISREEYHKKIIRQWNKKH